MKVLHLDHLVLTVASIEQTCRLYKTTMGMTIKTFGAGRVALKFGNQKINLHEAGREFARTCRTCHLNTCDKSK